MSPRRPINNRYKPAYDVEFNIPQKLEGLLKPKRYKIIIGGRGSGKSMSSADVANFNVANFAWKVLCMREFQSSIADSSYSLIIEEIARLGISGFNVNKAYIDHVLGGQIRFKGLARSLEAIKSYHGFTLGLIEEAQFLSEESIRILTPTFRLENSEIWALANPGSSEDPFSKEFLTPHWDEIQTNGYFEDDLHMIVRLNYYDNPWFPKILELERQKDKRNLPLALYEHIWLGMFNDSIENALIDAKWFDACIDAHIKLGFQAVGARIAAHDPSDSGPDAKGYAIRHGSIVFDVAEKLTGDINTGCDWALQRARRQQVDYFNWDTDGMGVGLNRQVGQAFKDTATIIHQFKGSQKVDLPNAVLNSIAGVTNQKKNKDAFKNQRAQYYYQLRNRIYNTYQAVTDPNFKWVNPENLISFSSAIKSLGRLRSELTRMPIKPNTSGLFELYPKPEMKSKFKLKSPNLGDSVMMLMRVPSNNIRKKPTTPTILKPMGSVYERRRLTHGR